MANILELTDANFKKEVLESDIPVLVDFWASWCGPCRMVAPILERIAEEYKGRFKVTKLNVDENQNTTTQFSIMNIPTLIFFKNGKEAGRVVGVVTKSELLKKADELLKD